MSRRQQMPTSIAKLTEKAEIAPADYELCREVYELRCLQAPSSFRSPPGAMKCSAAGCSIENAKNPRVDFQRLRDSLQARGLNGVHSEVCLESINNKAPARLRRPDGSGDHQICHHRDCCSPGISTAIKKSVTTTNPQKIAAIASHEVSPIARPMAAAVKPPTRSVKSLKALFSRAANSPAVARSMCSTFIGRCYATLKAYRLRGRSNYNMLRTALRCNYMLRTAP